MPRQLDSRLEHPTFPSHQKVVTYCDKYKQALRRYMDRILLHIEKQIICKITARGCGIRNSGEVIGTMKNLALLKNAPNFAASYLCSV